MEMNHWFKGFMRDEKTRKIYDAYKFHGLESRDEGIKIGMEKGMKKGKQEIAKEMIQDEMPIEYISKFTKLPIEEIEKLTLKEF